ADGERLLHRVCSRTCHTPRHAVEAVHAIPGGQRRARLGEPPHRQPRRLIGRARLARRRVRLQLTRASLVLVLVLAPRPASAVDTVVSSKVQVYADTDATVVVSPHVNAAATISSTKTTISGSYTEDVVSSASVDVRSTASPRIYDRRQEV